MKNGWIIGVGMVLIISDLACQKKENKPVLVPQATTAPAANTSALPPEEPLPDLKIQPTKKQAKYYPEGSPTRAIQDLDDMLDSYIVDPQTPEQKQYNKDLKRIVLHGTFDVRELCMLALANHWAERTPEEQNYFVDLMTRLLEKKAIFSKEQGQKKSKKKAAELYKVSYQGDIFLKADKSQALTKSTIHIPSEKLNIGLHYKMKKVDAGWRIYDVIVDGASLLDNYKYQFDKIIGKEGYPNLVHRMETKLKEIAAGAVQEE